MINNNETDKQEAALLKAKNALIAKENKQLKVRKDIANIELKSQKLAKDKQVVANLENKVKAKSEAEKGRDAQMMKIIDIVSKNSKRGAGTVNNLSAALVAVNKFNPLNSTAEKIKDSIIQASKAGLAKSDDEIKYEIRALEKSEQMLSLMGDTDKEKEQALYLKDLLASTKKTLKANVGFHKKFSGYLAQNTVGKIADVIEGLPVIGSLFGLVRESRKQAKADQNELSAKSIDTLVDDLANIKDSKISQKGSSAGASAEVSDEGYLKEIDITTKETLLLAKKSQGIDVKQINAIEKLAPGEEQEREKVRLDNKMLSVLQGIADNSKASATTSATNQKAGALASTGGMLDSLGNIGSIATALIGGGGLIAGVLAKFGKIKSVFTGIGKLLTKIPGVAAVGGVLKKLISFPVQFVLASLNGVTEGFDKWMKTGELGQAVQAGLDGFSNFWFMGFFDEIRTWITDNDLFRKVSEPLFFIFKKIGEASDWVDEIAEKAGLTQKAPTAKSQGVGRIAEPVGDYRATPSVTPLTQVMPSSQPVPSSKPRVAPSRGNGKNALHEEGFIENSKAVADRLGIDHTDLMKVIGFESKGFDAQARNPGSSASGLIQFMEKTAPELGTDIESIRQMSGNEQLKYVEEYLKQHGVKAGMGLQEIYMSVLAGNTGAAKKSALWNSRADPNTKSGQQERKNYEANKGLDIDRDGTISPMEATQMVEKQWDQSNRALFEEASSLPAERETAEMTYQNQTPVNTGATNNVIAPSNRTVNNNSNVQNTTMQIPIRHNDMTLSKFNPVLV